MADDRGLRTLPGDVPRRTVLAAAGAALSGSLAGCTGTQQPIGSPDPVALSAEAQCDACGMVVAEHPGPTGEIFYEAKRPETHGNPARFDSLRGCLFRYYFEHERLGWETAAVYVTDYSTVDYTLTSEGDRTFVSSHTDAASFTDARTAVYVVGSGVYGAMGEEFIPFSMRADADGFVADHGGDVLEFDDVSIEALRR